MYIFMYIFQGTDATMGDGFSPLGPPLLPWENRMGRGQSRGQTSQLLDRIGPVGQFGENRMVRGHTHTHTHTNTEDIAATRRNRYFLVGFGIF